MIRPEDIEIRSARFKTLDNGACGVEVEWTTPDLAPNVKFNLYSLSYDLYREYCENETIFKWCNHVVYQNEFVMKTEYDKIINDPATKVYLFHGTNAEMLDDFLVRGTFFTTNLEIAMKYGKTIYALELNNHSFNYFQLNNEGYCQNIANIPLSYCMKLNWEGR